MPIYLSERTIGVLAPSAWCDSCAKSYDVVSNLNEMHIRRIGNGGKGSFLATYPGFAIDGMPKTDEEVIAQAVSLGWKVEKVHDKTMMFCPDCKLK